MRMTGKSCIEHVNLTNKSKNSSKALLVFICLVLSSIVSILMNGTQSIAATLPGENLGTVDNLDGDWASATSIKIQDNSTVKKDEFEFAIYDLNGNSDYNKPMQVVKNREDGTFVFDTITYSTVGTYRYSIVELNNKLPGWKYDASEYLATVNVSDNGNGTLTAEKHIDKIINGMVTDRNIQDIVFTNSYSCESVDFTPIAIKRIDGNENHRPNDMKFTFVLKDSDGNELDRATNDENGLVSFNRISYTGVGNYTYTISEIVDKTSIGNAAITYDATVKKLNVTVNNDGTGHLSVNAMYPDNINIDDIDIPAQNYVHTTGSALFVNKLTYDIPNNTDAASPSDRNGTPAKSDISELMQTGIENFCAVISLIAFILITLLVHKRRIK